MMTIIFYIFTLYIAIYLLVGGGVAIISDDLACCTAAEVAVSFAFDLWKIVKTFIKHANHINEIKLL